MSYVSYMYKANTCHFALYKDHPSCVHSHLIFATRVIFFDHPSCYTPISFLQHFFLSFKNVLALFVIGRFDLKIILP